MEEKEPTKVEQSNELTAQIQTRERPTLMDGKVITFATEFSEQGYGMLQTPEARGPFEVSASRNAVMVHHAECVTGEQVALLIEAIHRADQVRENLRQRQ